MKVFVWLGLFASFSAAAKLHLNISISNKKGINLGLILASELHSIREVQRGTPVVLRMKNGIAVTLIADFETAFRRYGPSEFVLIRGKIHNRAGDTLENFMDDPIAVALGSKKTIVHNKKNQLIELIVEPEIH